MPIYEGVRLQLLSLTSTLLPIHQYQDTGIIGAKPHFAIEAYSCCKRLFSFLGSYADFVTSLLYLLPLCQLSSSLLSYLKPPRSPISSYPFLLPLLPPAFNCTLDLPYIVVYLFHMPVLALLPSLLFFSFSTFSAAPLSAGTFLLLHMARAPREKAGPQGDSSHPQGVTRNHCG